MDHNLDINCVEGSPDNQDFIYIRVIDGSTGKIIKEFFDRGLNGYKGETKDDSFWINRKRPRNLKEGQKEYLHTLEKILD